jgi:hypothetical protein
MSNSLGDFATSTIVYGKFTTYRPSTGAPFTLAGTPALSVYKDNSTTQSTTGVTLTVDFDSVTGLHHFAIDTSADGSFYAAGSFFDIVITTGTVDSVSAVGTVVGSFTLAKGAAFARIGVAGAGLTDITINAASVDLVWDEVLTGGTHNVANSAGRRLRAIQEFQGYEGGAVWLDTISGTAGTTSYENGTAENPVDLLASAVTIAGNVGLNSYHTLNGSSITLASTFAYADFVGDNWILALGGQSISGCYIYGAAGGVSGTATGTNPFFRECSIGTATLPPCALDRCGLSSTLTVGATGDYFLVDCFSQIAGSSAPVIDVGAAIGPTNLSIRRWAGGLTINNLASGDVITLDGVFGTLTLNGADASVEIRGIAKAVVNNLTGTPTVNDNTIKETQLDAIELDTGTTLPAQISALNDISVTDIFTTPMTEAYAADGAAMTLAQSAYMQHSMLAEKAVVSTTMTTYKLDGTTVAMTFTLNSATTPTAITRAT